MPGVEGWRGINRQSTEDFGDNENTRYDTLMVDACQYIFNQAHKIHNTWSELKVPTILKLIWTVDFEWLWYASVNSSVVTNIL